ncbi:MAG TPA: ABC transporter permease subunit [Steroidobacteraceae bacterium]|nr:ABC transporter permease subunit [Steroidobacteraceae bacterium]
MNLRGIWAVFRKEFRENLRDRRTLLSALVFGPVLGPVLVAALVQFGISRAETQSDENLSVAVAHAERAPNLLAYLNARGIDIVKVEFDEAQARAAVAAQTHKIILEIPEDFGARLQDGQPAPVVLYSDGSRGFERRGVARVRQLVSQYGIEIAQLRFLARGIDPISVLPISVQEIDVSTPTGRSVLVLNMMTYLVLLSMLFGGLYLAIDATAGERERGSLEVLLTAPVPRENLIYGKIGAAAAYMLISLCLTVTMFAVAISFVGLEQLGITANLGPKAALTMIACCTPLVLFGAAYLSIVSGFAKSYREAQTYLGLVITIPTLPLMFAGLLGLQAKTSLMFVPFLSQHLLLTTVVRAEEIVPLHVAISVISTVIYGAALTWIAGRLYRREGLLG